MLIFVPSSYQRNNDVIIGMFLRMPTSFLLFRFLVYYSTATAATNNALTTKFIVVELLIS